MLAVLSDIHGNYPALQAVVADAHSRGCTRFISLGDVAGYGAQPGECIDLLRDIGGINILGNHDSYITRNENCPRSRVVSQIIDYQRTVLAPSQVDWLKSSYSTLTEKDLLFVHGGPDNPLDQYIYSVCRSTVPKGIRLLFAGHTHVQTFADFGECGFCNPGSVGQPRDGDNRAAYATFDGSKINLFRVSYDINKSVQAMKKSGFQSFCYENLYTGSQIGGRIDHIKIDSSGNKI